LSKTLSVTNSM